MRIISVASSRRWAPMHQSCRRGTCDPVQRPEDDFRDAGAIAAVRTTTMKFVVTKTGRMVSDLQALHRVRERLVNQRTGIINQIRAFLLERGIAVRHGQRFLRVELPRILAPPDVLSPAWCVSLRGWLLTGIGWMSASKVSQARWSLPNGTPDANA